MFNKTRINIENKLGSNGKPYSLINYTDELLNNYKDESIPVKINAYLKKRRIEKIEIDPEITHNAYIDLVDDSYFVLKCKKHLDSSNPKDRFSLAHEIAHTFQYEIKSRSIINNYKFKNGSMEQEYFSNFLARAILLPSDYINQDVDKNVGSFGSLKHINELSNKYKAEYDKIIKRVLNDLRLFDDVVILRFIYFHNEITWRLYESFMSENIRYNKKYFVPRSNFDTSIEYKKRFPSCEQNLNIFLSSLTNKMNKGVEMCMEIEKAKLNDKILKTLQPYMPDRVLMNISYVTVEKYKSKTINFMLSLNK